MLPVTLYSTLSHPADLAAAAQQARQYLHRPTRLDTLIAATVYPSGLHQPNGMTVHLGASHQSLSWRACNK